MKYYNICRLASKILLYAFLFSVILSYISYVKSFSSAPFYRFVLSDAAETLLPSGIMYMLSEYLKKKDI